MEQEKGKEKYYLEFIHVNSDEENYDMQSKWFDSSEEALSWLKENFDFICEGMNVFLMTARFNIDGGYDIISSSKVR